MKGGGAMVMGPGIGKMGATVMASVGVPVVVVVAPPGPAVRASTPGTAYTNEYPAKVVRKLVSWLPSAPSQMSFRFGSAVASGVNVAMSSRPSAAAASHRVSLIKSPLGNEKA